MSPKVSPATLDCFLIGFSFFIVFLGMITATSVPSGTGSGLAKMTVFPWVWPLYSTAISPLTGPATLHRTAPEHSLLPYAAHFSRKNSPTR